MVKSALIVIDIINSCCSPKCETKELGITFKKIRNVVPKISKFVSEFKKQNIGPVIYINCTKWDKKHLAQNLVELYKDPKCEYYSDDSSGHDEKFYKIKLGKNDLIISKNTYDAFSNPKLEKFLKRKKINDLIIIGVFSDGCVESTIQNGFSRGYNFIILKDLIETTDLKIRQDMQKILKNYTWPTMFGKTITSKEFLRGVKKWK